MQMSDFDPAYRSFVSYIDKSRVYYRHKGYDNPYRWATHVDTPFATPAKPLAQSRIGVVTTAALNAEGGINRRVFSAAAHPVPESIHTHHLSWHKTATHTRDMGTYLPLTHLHEFAVTGVVGDVAPRFYGVPTKYSQRQTNTEDAPAILEMCRADVVDVVLLIPI